MESLGGAEVPEVPVLPPASRTYERETTARGLRGPLAFDLREGPVDVSIRSEVTGSQFQSEDWQRVLSVIVAAIALAVLFPLFIAIAVVIKLTSTGPIIYRQSRVGIDRRRTRVRAMYDRRHVDLGGEIFTIYKFRTMRVDSEREGMRWAGQNDGRVTRVGKILRLTRMDELPQLLNVLRGDMNIVGPRPERPLIFQQLREEIMQYALRQRARPGITGWAQINQKYDSTVADVRRKVQYDLAYLDRRSVAEDLRIMLKTIPVMLFRRGAQ